MTSRRLKFRRKPKPGSDTNDVSAPLTPDPAETGVGHFASTSAEASSAAMVLPVAGSPSHVPSANSSAALSIPGCSPTTDKAQSLWDVAFKKLAEKDQKMFSLAVFDAPNYLENLLEDAKKQKRECDEKKWTFDFRGKVIELRELADKVIDWLEKFKAVGDVIVQFDPIHAALPWGAVRFLLQIAINDKQTKGIILVGIEKIANLLGRCTAYEELYLRSMPLPTDHAKLQETLIELYTAILEFLAGAKRYFQESKANSFIRTLLNPAAKKTLLDAIEEKESHLKKYIPIVEAICRKNDHSSVEGKLQLLLDNWDTSLKMIPRIDEKTTSMHVSMEEHERLEILQWISTVKYDDHHMNAKSGLLENTGEWLFQNAKWKEWRSSTSSGFIWLQGKPGAGKTMLTCKVIDTLQSEPNNGPVIFFYCNRAEEPRRDSSVILHTLLKQLSVQSPSSKLPILIKKAYMPVKERGIASSQWEFPKCQELLTSLIEIYPQTTMVIDALDEIDDDQREVLLEALNKVVQSSPTRVKVFVSSRNDQDIQALKRDSIDAIGNKTDIENFVQREVTVLIEKRWKHLKDKNALTEEIMSALIDKADGMFLWVDLQIKHLSQFKMESDIRRDLGNLPKTLGDTYKQIYHDTILAAPGNEPEAAKKALGWIMVARRPLTPQQWVEATEKATQESLYLNQLLELCHNLVTNDRESNDTESNDIESNRIKSSRMKSTDTESNVIRYIHLSVREYLVAEHDFDVPKFHTMAAQACLTVLIDNAQPGPSKVNSFADYAFNYWQDHVERSDDKYMKEDTWKLMRTFLGTPEKPTKSYQKYSEYLRNHSWHYTSRMYKIYHDLIAVPPNPLFALSCFSFGRICTDLWNWSGVDVNCRNANGDSALTVASRRGNDAMVRLLLDRCTDAVCDKLIGSDNPLEAAIRHDQPKVVATLLSYRADITAKLCKTTDPLHFAVKHRNVAVVQAVLNYKGLGSGISERALLAASECYPQGPKILQVLLDSDKTFTCSQEVGTKVMDCLSRELWSMPKSKTTEEFEGILSLWSQFLNKNSKLELSARLIAKFVIYGGNQILDGLLKYKNHSFVITEDVIFAVARECKWLTLQHLDAWKLLDALIERCPNLEMLENVLQRAQVGDETLVKVILDRHPDMRPPNAALCSLAASSESRDMLIRILDKYPDMEIDKDVLIAAANYESSTLEMLLDRDSSIQVSEDVLIAAAKYGSSALEMLLDRDSSIQVQLSENAWLAIARSEGSALEMLLARDNKIKVGASVLEALALAESGQLSRVKMILEREPGLEPTDSILEAVARNKRRYRHAANVDETDPVEIMKLLLVRNDKLQISDRILEAAVSGYPNRFQVEIVEFLLSKPGIVISESTLTASIKRNAPVITRLLLAGNIVLDFVTSEAVLVAAAQSTAAPELLYLLLNSASDAKAIVKEKEAEAPVETQQELVSLLPKDRKVYITENVLLAVAEPKSSQPRTFEFLLRYDPKIRITGAVADKIMSHRRVSRETRFLLLSKFKENLTQEALENFEHYS